MNKSDNDGIGDEVLTKRSRAKNTRARTTACQKAGGVRPVGGNVKPASESLTREARRLLQALGLPETRAFDDPTDETGVILGRRRSAMSVGAGRFSRDAAESLARHDLAQWHRGQAGTRSLLLTEAGRAHLRRADAPEPDSPFFHQHRETELVEMQTEAGGRRVRMDTEESPLDWLRRRKGRNGEPLIDEASYQAGERLRTDIMLAGLLPSVTARWDATPKGTGHGSPSDATDRMVAARQRIRNAFDAIGGDFTDLLMDLCGFLKGLELIERERQWPPRSAKVVVRIALARLAEHYGIEAAARGPAASRGVRSWQAVVIAGGRS